MTESNNTRHTSDSKNNISGADDRHSEPDHDNNDDDDKLRYIVRRGNTPPPPKERMKRFKRSPFNLVPCGQHASYVGHIKGTPEKIDMGKSN